MAEFWSIKDKFVEFRRIFSNESVKLFHARLGRVHHHRIWSFHACRINYLGPECRQSDIVRIAEFWSFKIEFRLISSIFVKWKPFTTWKNSPSQNYGHFTHQNGANLISWESRNSDRSKLNLDEFRRIFSNENHLPLERTHHHRIMALLRKINRW